MDSKEKKNIKVVTLTLSLVSVLLLGSFIIDKNIYDLCLLIVMQISLFNFLHIKLSHKDES